MKKPLQGAALPRRRIEQDARQQTEESMRKLHLLFVPGVVRRLLF